jgi:hypothetical protein
MTLEVPKMVRLRRAIRLLGLSRRMRDRRLGGPRYDQVLLRALDALAEAGQLAERTGRVRRELAKAIEAAGLERLPVFSRPRSMVRRETR